MCTHLFSHSFPGSLAEWDGKKNTGHHFHPLVFSLICCQEAPGRTAMSCIIFPNNLSVYFEIWFILKFSQCYYVNNNNNKWLLWLILWLRYYVNIIITNIMLNNSTASHPKTIFHSKRKRLQRAWRKCLIVQWEEQVPEDFVEPSWRPYSYWANMLEFRRTTLSRFSVKGKIWSGNLENETLHCWGEEGVQRKGARWEVQLQNASVTWKWY